jgi:predicted house-cleaning noncanonical NTP pyrophosphatase (MazG superfamily)
MPARSARSSRRKPRQFPHAESILGPSPLFEGEDQKAYEALLNNVRAAIKPPNFLVELLIPDIVYHTWSIARYRCYEVEFSKKLEESEKIFHTDRLGELAIMMARLARVQQMIASSEQRRLKAYKQIEYLSTKFAKALRKAIAEAHPQYCGEQAGGDEPAAGRAA